MLRTLFCLTFAALALLPMRLQAAPAALDCVTTSPGFWNSPDIWSGCDGGIPTAADDVFIQSGHTVTLTADAAVENLHLSLGQVTGPADDARLFLDSFVLDLYGKLRAYRAPVGTFPGTSSGNVISNPIAVTRGTGGRVRVVGGSRILAATGEWGNWLPGSNVQPFALEVALSSGAVVTTQVTVRASNWTITSGTLVAGNTLYVGEATAGAGSFVVGPEGTLAASAPLACDYFITYTCTQSGGTFVVNGKLVLTGALPRLFMRTVAFNNIVEYAATYNQTLVPLNNNGNISLYQHLVLSGGGVKTLPEPITVAGSLTLAGTASLKTSTQNTLTYGPEAQIIYAGATPQVAGSEMAAVAASIGGLVVANPTGVQLNRSLSVDATLSLAGPLDLGANTLTLAPSVTCSGRSDVLGTVLRASIPAPGAYCFGNPNVVVTLPLAATLPSSISVTRTRGVAPFPGAVLLRYQIAAPGFAGTADLRLAYDGDDLNGNDAALLHLWRTNGSLWQLQAATARGVDAYGKPYVERSGITAFSDWALADGSAPTAVTVADLTASVQDSHALLTWHTTSELGCQAFVVRRSRTAGDRGELLAEIPAQLPGSLGGAAYTWRDPEPLAFDSFGSPIYYRLDVIDTAGIRQPTDTEVALHMPGLYLPLLAR
jgi:hypothetical protein